MASMSPPVSPQPTEARPRASTAMSHDSRISRRSNSSAGKIDHTENHEDKKRLHTKADPSKAMTEATPAEIAQGETTVEDIRQIAHKDHEGNVIADPDRSNPTRHRMERPLDTIRSFHAAAEGTSSRRSSYSRPVSQVGMNGDNRRASHYSQNGYGYSPQRPRMSSGGYYRNSTHGFVPQSAVEESPGSSQMYAPRRQYTHPHHGPPTGYPNGYQNGYQNGQTNQDSPVSAHSYQHSYDAMTSGSEEYGKSTNPSSQNSSFDQLHQIRNKHEEYAQDSPNAKEIQFNQVSPTQLYSYGGDGVHAQQFQPPVPAQAFNPPPVNNPRQTIKLGGADMSDFGPPSPPKKQSWLKRRFSKKA